MVKWFNVRSIALIMKSEPFNRLYYAVDREDCRIAETRPCVLVGHSGMKYLSNCHRLLNLVLILFTCYILCYSLLSF